MRGQLDTAVGMILTIVIVVAVLTLAVWGFNELTKTSSDAAYRAVSDSLSEAGARYASFGSQAVVYVNAPEPFCIFNTSANPLDRSCEPGYSGHAVCDGAGLESYWDGAGAEDGNLVFRSGINERLDLIAPHNGAYACFRSGRQPVFIEGRGRYSTVSPMREIRSIALHVYSGGVCDPTPTARFRLFTSSPTSSQVELAGFEGLTNTYCTQTPTTLTFGDGTSYEIDHVSGNLFVINVDVSTSEIVSLTMVRVSAGMEDVPGERLVLLS
jgi:hypothetical protein